VYSGRLDTSLSGVLAINFKSRKTIVFCSAGTSPRGPYDPVQSRMDVFMKQWELGKQVGCHREID
jgi:hypothetical protein